MQLIYCNILDFPKNIKSLLRSLPQKRQDKIKRYLKKSDQLLCLGAGLLLNYGLGDSYATHLSYNAYGKPFLDGSNHDLFFNLSHSGDYVVLAISDKSIGVDVQQHENGNYLAMSKISFHPLEQKYLASCKNQREVFYTFWTLKESYMKAVGTGFFMHSNAFEISLANDLPRLQTPSTYSLFNIPFHSGYSLGLCTENPFDQSEPKCIKF